MRANVSTTRIFHQSLWFSVSEAWAEVGPLSRQLVDADALSLAFADALEDAFNTERVLPHGVALGELGGSQTDDLYAHAAVQLEALLDMAEKHGADVVVMWLGMHGMISVQNWWGTPRWPFVVDELFLRLDEPHHDHWRTGGAHPGPPPPPADDRAWFRDTLLTAPDDLPTEVVDYCIHRAALGSIDPRP